MSRRIEPIYDPKWVDARRRIYTTYGKHVSFFKKGKSLDKFGRRTSVGTSWTTVTETQAGSSLEEVYPTANTIDTLVGDADDAGKLVYIEGHYEEGGYIYFATQVLTHAGTTPVPLTRSLCRGVRARIVSTGDLTTSNQNWGLVGPLYVYDSADSGGLSSGAPIDPDSTHLYMSAGETESFKGATTTSSVDYWGISEAHVECERTTGSSINVDFRMQYRLIGGPWWPIGGATISMRTDDLPFQDFDFKEPRIIPAASDVRLQARASSGTADVNVNVSGLLAVEIDPEEAFAYVA